MARNPLPPSPFPEWPEPAVTGLVDIEPGPIEFTPVPRLRRRRNGWTPEAQRAFIEALSECGCVAAAARSVGMTPRSAYRLLDSEGADSFAEAWDQAIARGVENLRGQAMGRALHGAWVPVMRRGRIVRIEHRSDNKLAIALLSGRNGSVAENRERASSRRKHRLKLRAEQERQRLRKQLEEEIWAEHLAILDEIERERENPTPLCVTSPPRIRSL